MLNLSSSHDVLFQFLGVLRTVVRYHLVRFKLHYKNVHAAATWFCSFAHMYINSLHHLQIFFAATTLFCCAKQLL